MRRELVSEAKAALDALAHADIAQRDRTGLDAVLADMRRVRRVLEGFEIEVARRTRELASEGRSECAEGVLTEGGRRSNREARAAAARERTCTAIPGLEQALHDGTVSGGHVDALASATNGLDDDTRQALVDRAEELLEAATAESVADFGRTAATWSARWSRTTARLGSSASGASGR